MSPVTLQSGLYCQDLMKGGAIDGRIIWLPSIWALLFSWLISISTDKPRLWLLEVSSPFALSLYLTIIWASLCDLCPRWWRFKCVWMNLYYLLIIQETPQTGFFLSYDRELTVCCGSAPVRQWGVSEAAHWKLHSQSSTCIQINYILIIVIFQGWFDRCQLQVVKWTVLA